MLQRPNQVLVIDDDEAAREILVELLGRIGFHAFAAPDGKAGLEWLAGAAAPPQAVLLDLRMPVLDGFEVLRRYRAEGGTAPVIALSAMDEKEAVVKEEVSVGKRKVHDTEHVSGTVRKEEVKVEETGNVEVHNRTDVHERK